MGRSGWISTSLYASIAMKTNVDLYIRQSVIRCAKEYVKLLQEGIDQKELFKLLNQPWPSQLPIGIKDEVVNAIKEVRRVIGMEDDSYLPKYANYVTSDLLDLHLYFSRIGILKRPLMPVAPLNRKYVIIDDRIAKFVFNIKQEHLNDQDHDHPYLHSLGFSLQAFEDAQNCKRKMLRKYQGLKSGKVKKKWRGKGRINLPKNGVIRSILTNGVGLSLRLANPLKMEHIHEPVERGDKRKKDKNEQTKLVEESRHKDGQRRPVFVGIDTGRCKLYCGSISKGGEFKPNVQVYTRNKYYYDIGHRRMKREEQEKLTSRAVLDLRDGILRRLLPFPQIQLTLVNEENGVVVLSLSKGRSRSCMMKHLFGDFVHSMVAIEQSDNGTRLQGSILIPGGMKNPSSNLQYLYLNNRVVECLVLQQMIESMYSNAFQLVHEHSSQQPVKFVYLLQLETTTDKFEIILEQDKTIVEFKDSDGVFKFIKRALVEAWSTHLPHSVMNKLISRSFTKESNVNPVGNENSMKRKVSSLFSPIISSRNRSLISVQASYAEVEDDENFPLVASLNQSTQNSSSIESTTDMSTPIKTTQSPTEIDSLTDKEIAESEDSEIQWVSAPPFYKKIKRSVHFNPPISLSTTSHTSCNLESSSNVQGPIQDVNPHPVIPATRHRSYPKRTQNWTNTDFGAKLKNSADCSVKSMDSMTTGETVRVIGCFDNKFILIQKGTRIIAVDQHAADERVILEHIERQIIEELSTGFAHPVEQPIETRIAPLEQEIFTNYSQHLAQWGWKGEFTNTGFLRVTHQPRILGVSLNLIDLKVY
eukprot:g2418.t1